MTSAQVRDTYLLTWAKSRNGKLANLDRRLSAAAVKDSKSSLYCIATA